MDPLFTLVCALSTDPEVLVECVMNVIFSESAGQKIRPLRHKMRFDLPQYAIPHELRYVLTRI